MHDSTGEYSHSTKDSSRCNTAAASAQRSMEATESAQSEGNSIEGQKGVSNFSTPSNSAEEKKPSSKHNGANVRSVTDRYVATPRVEDGLPALQLANYDGDHPQEFDHEEVVMTMEEDPKQSQRSSLLDTSIRELAEHPRSPLPNPSIWTLAGFPRGSLPSAGVQELAEHSYQPVSRVLEFRSI